MSSRERSPAAANLVACCALKCSMVWEAVLIDSKGPLPQPSAPYEMGRGCHKAADLGGA